MSGALEVAAVGLQVQQRALDAIANNIANINTPAFKRSEFRFSELVDAGMQAGTAVNAADLRYDPIVGVDFLARPMIDRQGLIERTGNARDIAIDGAGFIELLGPAGHTLLWRGGTLKVLEDGALANSAGLVLKAGITVPADATTLRIDRDGKVYVALSSSQGETQIGQINLVKLADSATISRMEGGIYAVTDDASVSEGASGDDGLGYLVQASLERSNVDLNSEMVNLLVAQRAYAANTHVIRAADEFLGLANSLRR